MLVTTFNSKRLPGLKRWSDLANEETAMRCMGEPVELNEALTRTWDADTHFVTYVAEDEDGDALYARVNKGAFVQQLEQAGGRVVVRALVFDHDLPRLEGGEKQEWSADSLESFLGDLKEAVGDSNLEPTAWYTTLHGSRFVYELTEPVDKNEAEAMMLGVMQEFARRGIELDDACKDWTRLFRLPNVEREGYGRYESLVVTGGPLLDTASVPRGEVKHDELSGEVNQYDGDMPDPDEVRDLLEETKDNGRKYKTELVKRAKLMLQGRDSERIVFEHGELVKGDENWNTQVLHTVSSVVGMMSEEACSSPEGIYALLHSAIEQLQAEEMQGANQTDWHAITWDLICRMWAKEDAKLCARRAEHEARQAEADEQRDDLLEAYREERPEDVPEDAEEAKQWFSRRMIASNGQKHYVMRPDGGYNIQPCPDSLLIPVIRRLGMEDVIPTTEIRGKSIANRSARDIINDHAMPIMDIECSVREPIAFIDGLPGYDKLHIPIHRLNPNLVACFDPRVDEWLEALGGEDADILKEWLAHSLDVKRAICALNLYGSPGTGKGMLALGISECFESMELNDGRALGKWNSNLLRSPLVNCDEGVPNISSDESLSLDQAFRTLVTGGKITIREMRTDPYTAELFPRILFTSNDRDIISAIVGHRDLTDDDTRAIEQRLLSIEVTPTAQALLTSKGNYAYTAGWVAGAKRSGLVLANHIYYLYQNREDSQTSTGRLLVEGRIQTKLVADLKLRSRDSETVMRSLVKLIDGAAGGQGQQKIHVGDSRVWATAASIVEYVENNLSAMRNDLTLKGAGRVLKHFSVEDARKEDGRLAKITPPGGKRGRWVEIDLGTLFEQALHHGIGVDQVERLLRGQLYGDERADQIEAAQ